MVFFLNNNKFTAFQTDKYKKALPATNGLAQAGVWLVRHFVSDSTPRSRPNRANTPACRQAAITLSASGGQRNGTPKREI